MKILLIQPPLPNFLEDPYPPLGLAYIAAMLEKNGYGVKIIDMPPLKLSIKKIKPLIEKYEPFIIGITCVAVNYNFCVQLSKIIKNIFPESIIVVGGPHVTFIPNKVLQKHLMIDIVVNGEGEITMLEIVKNIEKYGYNMDKLKSVKGIYFRAENGTIIRTEDRKPIEDLDTLPYPARHLLPMKQYKNLTKYTSIVASRGCPYNCIYCNASAFWKHTVRLRKPSEIIKEIETVMYNFGFNKFKFVDDNFLFPSKWTHTLLSYLSELDIKWICNARIDKVNENIIKEASKAGCEKIIFGIESLSPLVQQIIRKNLKINPDTLKKIIHICHKNDIKTKLNFIIGLPGQDIDDIKQIYRLLWELPLDEVSINPLTPYPGTYLFEHAKDLLNIKLSEWWDEEFRNTKIINLNNQLNSGEGEHEVLMIKEYASLLGIKVMEGY